MAAPFRAYGRYLKERYGEPVYRVAVDGGFSCPNRGPERERPGCSYCDEHGARAPYLEGRRSPEAGYPGGSGSLEERKRDLQRQVRGALSFLERRYGARSYLLYFQAFSATFAPVAHLRALYDCALALAPFRELVVSTRPDCVPRQTAELLSSYRREGLEVWVELGLQSAHDRTLERIGRGHDLACFLEAWERLRACSLKLAVHLIFGLPGEGWEEIEHTVRLVAALRPEGVKIHNLHVPAGCALHRELLAGELTVPSAPRHLGYVVRALELLPPETVIMRLTCDTPPERLAAPRRFWSKERFYREVREAMRREGRRQGARFAGP